MTYNPAWTAGRTRSYVVTGLDVNVGATDIGSFAGLPAKYLVQDFYVFDASTTPLGAAVVVLRTAAAGGGSALATAPVAVGMTSPSVTASGAPLQAAYVTASTLYLRTVSPNGAALTVSAVLTIVDLT